LAVASGQQNQTQRLKMIIDQGGVLSVLGQLLVSAGLPLVEGLTVDQMSCLTELTPGATACTPAAARDVLKSLNTTRSSSYSTSVAAVADTTQAVARASSGASGQTFDWLTELQQQYDQLQQSALTDGNRAPASSVAALLLSYCVADMGLEKVNSSSSSSSSSTQRQQQAVLPLRDLLLQLDGLPLLVMADGSHAKLQVLSTAATISNSSSSSSSSRIRGSNGSGGVSDVSGGVGGPAKYFVAGSEVEQQLLVGSAPGLVLQLELGSKLQQQLMVLAAAGVCGVGVGVG
jgi:hypothetical protein